MNYRIIFLVSGGFLITALLVSSVRPAEGDSLWAHAYGGIDWEGASSIVAADDGCFLLAGGTETFGVGRDVWLVKVNSQGDSLWSRNYGGNGYDWANCIIPSGDGDFLLAGFTSSFGAGSYDMWLLKVSAEGDSLWSHTYGGIGDERAFTIIPSGDGGFVLGGQTYSSGSTEEDMLLVKVSFEGNFLWSHTYGGSSTDHVSGIAQTMDGGFLLAGRTNSFGAGYSDMWLVQVTAQGDSVWSRTYGGDDYDWANCILPADDGGFLLAGWTGSLGSGGDDAWLMEVNYQGDLVWSNTYGGWNNEYAQAIIPSGDGGYLLAGGASSFGAGSEDMWPVKVNDQGDSLSSHTYGGGSHDFAFAITPTGDGNFLLAGETWSFGAGFYDMWLVAVEGGGTPVPPQDVPQPRQSVLHPPHPNPFNPATVLSYQLPTASHSYLRIYDTTGRQVTELAGGWREVGYHSITFDGTGLPSGIYFAKLAAGEFSQVQKLILLK